MDHNIITSMKTNSYRTVLLKYLGSELSDKMKELQIITSSKDIFLEYIKSIEGRKLFKEEQKILKAKMRDLLGLNDRTMGIGVCNGKLSDCQYQYKIISEKENSRKSSNWKKRYWMIISLKKNKPP